VLERKARELLADASGQISGELAPFLAALIGDERPDIALAWISRSRIHHILGEFGRTGRPVTHETLDELPADKTLAHLRSVLVATGALPARDERLITLERWVTTAVASRTNPAERQILRGYAIWHHLRRLRARLGTEHATHLQALNVRCHVTAAANFLDWLTAQNLTLATCTQPDLERWAVNLEASYREETGNFIRWSLRHRHAHHLTFGAERWTGPRSTIDGEKRWDDARRLLHDQSLPTGDRVAGLLLLLYAQKIATISHLRIGDVNLKADTVAISLGPSPVILPEPLAALVRELIATRSGKAKIGVPDDTPWLFPGGRPGQPIGDDRLGQRLKKIGLQPRQDRSTALFTLAAEVPAAILARTLGIHIQVAVQWQKASAGDWNTYAADISRRGTGQAG
jgi:hypothetical protein